MIQALQIIAVIGLMLAFLFVVSDPSTDVTRRSLRLFPELAEFDSEKDARRALSQAIGGQVQLRLVAFIVIALPLMFCCHFLASVIMAMFSRLTGYGSELSTIRNLISLSIAATLAGEVTKRVLARRIRASLREQLKAYRTPTCQACAYNLTGNISGACPECGTQITGPPGPTE